LSNEAGQGKKEPDPEAGIELLHGGLMPQDAHNLVARDLDQACPERSRGITASKDLQQGSRLIDQRAQIGGLGLPVLDQPSG
jgi:hypothetical protein